MDISRITWLASSVLKEEVTARPGEAALTNLNPPELVIKASPILFVQFLAGLIVARRAQKDVIAQEVSR